MDRLVRMKRLFFILACLAAAGAMLAWKLSAQGAISLAEWQAVKGSAILWRGGAYSLPVAAIPATRPWANPTRCSLAATRLKTPFGSFYPPNISSDPVDGIGAWRPLDLANALLSGVSPRDQHDYPAFPYTSNQRMN